MVKNKKGGSSHKKMARKNVAPKGGYMTRKLRLPKEDGEIIAKVTAMSGGGHAVILCTDGVERTLVIRGKFRGRNKRDNTIRVNSMVLVGLRSVTMGEIVGGKKKEKADILEIYPESRMEELRAIPSINAIMSGEKVKVTDDCAFEITNKIIAEPITLEELSNPKKKVRKKETLFKEKEEINWDDI